MFGFLCDAGFRVVVRDYRENFIATFGLTVRPTIAMVQLDGLRVE